MAHVRIRHRISIVLVALITAVGAAGVGSAMTAGPARALGDPLVDAHTTVLPSHFDSLAQLCLQIRPNPKWCAQLPLASASGGAVTVDGVSSRYSGFSLEGWKFTGAFVIGPQTLVGEVHGGSASVGTGQFGDAGKIYPFAIGGTSGGSTLSGTCEGMIVSGLPLNSLPVSVDQPLVLQLSCHASINSTPGDFQLVVVLPVATGDFVPDASFQVTHYAGTFGGVGV